MGRRRGSQNNVTAEFKQNPPDVTETIKDGGDVYLVFLNMEKILVYNVKYLCLRYSLFVKT